jgi:hypothetical protein
MRLCSARRPAGFGSKTPHRDRCCCNNAPCVDFSQRRCRPYRIMQVFLSRSASYPFSLGDDHNSWLDCCAVPMPLPRCLARIGAWHRLVPPAAMFALATSDKCRVTCSARASTGEPGWGMGTRGVFLVFDGHTPRENIAKCLKYVMI